VITTTRGRALLAGLSTGDALALGSLALGDFLLVCGLVALLRRPVYVDHETRHVIEVKSRFFKEVRAKYAAVIAVLVGAGLVVFPIWTHPRTPPTILISGTVLIQGGVRDARTRGRHPARVPHDVHPDGRSVRVEYPKSSERAQLSRGGLRPGQPTASVRHRARAVRSARKRDVRSRVDEERTVTRRAFLMLVLAMLSAWLVLSQPRALAILQGRLLDESGQPLAYQPIVLEQVREGVGAAVLRRHTVRAIALTDGHGLFQVVDLPAGTYLLNLVRAGADPIRIGRVRLESGYEREDLGDKLTVQTQLLRRGDHLWDVGPGAGQPMFR